MCKVCSANHFNALPPGATLTIWSPDEELTIVGAAHG
jgi:hypothetical protein